MILDSDLIWLAVMPDERLLSDFGLAAAQSFSLRRFAAENISHNAALALVAERDAIVPRANAAAALHHPPLHHMFLWNLLRRCHCPRSRQAKPRQCPHVYNPARKEGDSAK